MARGSARIDEQPSHIGVKPGWLIVFGMLLAYPLFQHLFPKSILLAVMIGASGLILLALMGNHRSLRVVGSPSLFFGLFIPIAAAGMMLNSSTSYDLAAFLIIVSLGIGLSFYHGWVESAVLAALLLLLIHALATVGFFLFPALFAAVEAETLLRTYPAAWDYRSALTAHYSYNGMYIAMGLVLAAAVAFSARSRPVRLLGVPSTVLFAVALILTTKRGPLVLAVFAVMVVVLALRGKRATDRRARRSRTFGLVVVGAAAALFVAVNPTARQVFDRLLDESASIGEYTSGRTGLWARAFELWQTSPLFGIGWGGYRYEWIDGGTPVISVGAHNVVLQLLAETGLGGAVLFIAGYVASAIMTMKKIRTVRSAESSSATHMHALLAGSLGIQVFFGSYCLIGNPLYDSPTFTAYFLAVAAASALVPLPMKNPVTIETARVYR